MAGKTKAKAPVDAAAPGESDPREVAYYSALLDAWQSTRMERDRSLLTLSSAAIGLLVTLLSSGSVHAEGRKPWFVLAFGAFVLAILTAVAIFERNAVHVRRLVRREEVRDRRLEWLDNLLVVWFVMGVLAFAGLGYTML